MRTRTDSVTFEDMTRTAAAADGIARFVVAAVACHENRVLLLRRPADDFIPGLWEPPRGRVEPGETFAQALRRGTAEETGLTIRRLGTFDHVSGNGGA